ncbi:GNAT family N-acetyltransferase [Paracoccus beibuensis]|uniref:GNAT family N-acetyltransferase n=1 Tax=Paracoccus beibuensis TaxID=547602 RepID=UPI0022408F93|nr:GNAT family N-acetyltransferase [Paracoccus beibuensis]
MQILHPIPDKALPSATALWRSHFGLLAWPRRLRPRHGMVAVGAAGQVLGVIGLRDAAGGAAAGALSAPGWLFRPAPPTGDLVIDGLAVAGRRRGTGRALVAEALRRARGARHPGLRAEVRARNRGALAFYRRLGFTEESRGRYGLPWWGQVHVLRLEA